jgi:hypothetical protein
MKPAVNVNVNVNVNGRLATFHFNLTSVSKEMTLLLFYPPFFKLSKQNSEKLLMLLRTDAK